ncbi:heavy metal-responsive transcriptional regulator [Phormidium sp. CLA17]|uniref:heavy metal-responsive transcriptional regulator n=1 Tax=Leptolyngbya sp. Cla-17 TaxID=2803751 RepID=UPI001490EF39|nr:heavy metal-responsive transcriptional regulator [Leptolyngbya sp. Cla-17]MBM0742350.1 heavy metal-responsive transcriptional regulator [Leptolyngbya sp. Cla-17]
MTITDTKNFLKIGEVSTSSDLPIKTIRYYEEIGLLTPTVHRSETNYRLFEPTVLGRLAFIKRSQALGLSLREIQDLLMVHDQGQLPCDEVKQNLQKKVQQITKQIESLQLLRSELQGLLSGWHDYSSEDVADQTICPNLQTEAMAERFHFCEREEITV